MKRRRFEPRWIRIAAALVFATLLMGVCFFGLRAYGVFATQFGSSLLRLTHGFAIGAAAAVAAIALVTLAIGRLYCSVLCPLGLLQDLFSIGRKTQNRARYAPPFTALRYLVLGLTAALAATGLLLPLTFLLPSANAFWMANGVHRVAPLAGALLAWGTSFVLFLFVRWKGRTYCHAICPVGTLLSLLAGRSLFRLQMDSTKCIGCGSCERVCAGRCVDVQHRRIRTEDCILCLDCLSACPKQAISFCFARRRRASSPAPAPDAARRRFLIGAGALATGATAGALLGRLTPGATAAAEEVVLPPGAGDADRFHKTCIGCGACIAVCPGRVLHPATTQYGWRGFLQPHMDFEHGACLPDCTACMKACPVGALHLIAPKQKKLSVTLYNPHECQAFAECKPCGQCARACPTGAIEMIAFQNTAIPSFDETKCIGCGACRYACPMRPRAIRCLAPE